MTLLRESTASLLARGRYLTRLFTEIAADDMNEDPWFEPTDRLDDVSNVHVIDLREDPEFAEARPTTSPAFAYAGLVPVGLAFVWLAGRRQRRR